MSSILQPIKSENSGKDSSLLKALGTRYSEFLTFDH